MFLAKLLKLLQIKKKRRKKRAGPWESIHQCAKTWESMRKLDKSRENVLKAFSAQSRCFVFGVLYKTLLLFHKGGR